MTNNSNILDAKPIENTPNVKMTNNSNILDAKPIENNPNVKMTNNSNILGAKPIENNPNIKITNNFNVSEQKSLEYNLIEYKKIKYILANDSKKSIYKYELNKSNYKGILLGYLNKKNKIKFFKK